MQYSIPTCSFQLVPSILLILSVSSIYAAPTGGKQERLDAESSISPYQSAPQHKSLNEEPLVVFRLSDDNAHLRSDEAVDDSFLPVRTYEELLRPAPVLFVEEQQQPLKSLPLLMNQGMEGVQYKEEMKPKRNFQYYGARGKKSGFFNNLRNEQTASRFNYMPSRG